MNHAYSKALSTRCEADEVMAIAATDFVNLEELRVSLSATDCTPSPSICMLSRSVASPRLQSVIVEILDRVFPIMDW